MLKISSLEAGYGESQVLFGITLHIEKGDIVSMVGSNAAGKTTLLNIISGINKSWRGKVEFLGQDITDITPEKRIEMGLIQCPEGRRLFPGMTVLENLLLGAYAHRAQHNMDENLEKAYHMFPRLYERRYQLAGSLSGGEQQMCAIGRAIMANPELLILDEPSLGLAPIIVQQMFEIIREINAKGVTIFLVEQNVNKALSLAKKGYVIESGEIVMEGTGQALLHNDDLRKAYLGV
ncbi:ABC transporter ATP-binding protein [Vallitalea pronyensis]|uniref:ABC transporter ATP-binding protein n=1 Tax=Vallitalea pronyensis TaxID=1348613 RepID=A0A8J8MMN1_9FIRM|nr:ABC transporter ATP-binding protein [Vallitalea pronyensis]QUI24309.1 ABC transporter ATP-binding protein [Vallitalea pronyensis]